MMRALWSGASGMKTQQTNVDVIANNISNINTAGYKSSKAEFKTLLYQTVQARTTSANGEEKPIPAQVGLGTRLASTSTLYTQGSLQATGETNNFAINGNGFFQVRDGNGDLYYTRNGNFVWAVGANGNVQLCTQDGEQVMNSAGGIIELPAGVSGEAVVFSSTSGEFGYNNANGEYVALGTYIGVYQFSNPGGLEHVSGTRFEATEASGDALSEYTTATLSKSTVVSGYIEMSNVNAADEMVNLIVAQRAYEMNSRAITTADDMLAQANQLKR